MPNITTFSFVDSFKKKLSQYIEENYIAKGKDLSRLAIVFPGKRPSLYVKKELSRIIKKAFVPPKFFSIDQFIQDIVARNENGSKNSAMDKHYMLFKLAEKLTPEIMKGRTKFSEFLPWAKEILDFIDQLDLEDVPQKAIEDIKLNAEIGYDVPEDINDLLKKIIVLRDAFHSEMEKRGFLSRGIQYLKAKEYAAKTGYEEFDEIIFCSFFYFNKTEEAVVKSLFEKGKATLIFQGDQRKWPVLERLSKRFSCDIVEGKEPDEVKHNLSMHSCFDAHSQVACLREILKKTKDLDKTVVVVPEPGNLMPILSEISSVTDNYNVSMGYPVSRSSIYTLLDLIFKTQLSKNSKGYYSKDYLKAMRHPFIKNLDFGYDPTVTRIIVHKIEEVLIGKEKSDISGSIFISLQSIENAESIIDASADMINRLGHKVSKDDVRKIIEQVHSLIFTAMENMNNFAELADALGLAIKTLLDKSPVGNYPMNYTIVEKILDILDDFNSASFNHEFFPQEEIFSIFEDKISTEMISFHGTPLKGLQVLGLLEIRSLDFENIIVIDANEGVLPKLRMYDPLIPKEVKISLNIDSLELEEEIQRYQFMRLISSAKKVHLIYQENKEKEKSRFVEELIWEEQKKNNGKVVSPIQKQGFHVSIPEQKVSFRKTSEIIEHLKNYTYSASSINSYLRDPVEFYYSYVLELKEQEDLLDEPDAKMVGTFIHNILHESFQRFVGRRPLIDKEFEKDLFDIFESRFEETFSKSMRSDAFLVKNVMQERLKRFLENERENPARQIQEIVCLEKVFSDTLSLSCGNIKFKYIVDRVDRMQDGTLMIIDYKTGTSDKMPKNINGLDPTDFSRETIFEKIGSFQMPLYFHYMLKEYPKDKINAGLYSLKTMKVTNFIDRKNEKSYSDIDSSYIKALDFVVSEILDPNVPFEV